eukprot:gene36451-biopygen5857
MAYPQYDEVEYEEDELKKDNDPYGLKRREMEKLMSMRLEKMDRLETNKPRVYALIIGRLSQDSLDKVRQMPNCDTFDNEGDPLELIKMRYDGRIAALNTLDEHILEEPALLAIDFIHKLDVRRYHELRKDYEVDRSEAATRASKFTPVGTISRETLRHMMPKSYSLGE